MKIRLNRFYFFIYFIFDFLFLLLGPQRVVAFEPFKCEKIQYPKGFYYTFKSSRKPQCSLSSSKELASLKKKGWLEFFNTVHTIEMPDSSSCTGRLKSEQAELISLLSEDIDRVLSNENLSEVSLDDFSKNLGGMFDDLEEYRKKEAERKAEISQSSWRSKLQSAASKIASAAIFNGPQGVAGKMVAKSVLSAVSGGYAGMKFLYQKYFGKASSERERLLDSHDSPSKESSGGGTLKSGPLPLRVKLKDLIPTNHYKVAYIRTATGVVMVGLGAVGVAASVAIPYVGGLPFVLSAAGVDVAARYLETHIQDDARRLGNLRNTLENSHYHHQQAERYEQTYEVLREGSDKGIEIGTEEVIKHALERAAEHSGDKLAASAGAMSDAASHGATAEEHGAASGFMHAIPVIGSTYAMTRGLKKTYQAWKGLEPSYQEAKIQEDVYRAIVKAELDRKKNDLLSVLNATEQLSEFYNDSPYRKEQFIEKSNCMCQAIQWVDRVSDEAKNQFDVRMNHIDKKLDRQKKISQLSEKVKGFFGLGHKKAQENQLKALNADLLQVYSQLKLDQDQLSQSLSALVSNPDQVLRSFDQKYPPIQFQRKGLALSQSVQDLNAEVLRIRQRNVFAAELIKEQLAKVATPPTPGATVVSFSMEPAKLGAHSDGSLALKSFTEAIQAQHAQLKNAHAEEMKQMNSMILQLSHRRTFGQAERYALSPNPKE